MRGPGGDGGGGGGLVSIFARHPTAANLLMAMMIVAGLLSLQRLNTQFFPEFGIDVISVSVVWPGASASDVEETIVGAIEPEVRFIDGVDNVISAAREGQGTISIEFQPGTDMQEALANVESAVAQVTTLPEAAERPVVRRIVRYDTISRISVSGPFPESSLKVIAKRIREDLLARGIDKVTLSGARDEEIWIEVAPETLLALDLTLADIAERVRASSRDIPAGETRGAAQVQLRSLGQARTAEDFAAIEVRALESGEKIALGSIAELSDRFDDSGVVGRIHGDPAIELHVQRAVGADALELAEVVDSYLDELRPTLPPSLALRQYDVAATLISDRINLLLRNGGGGLLLVLAVLFLFLTGRVAFWVAVGIPVSLMATLGVMFVTGQSINMVSLFALIMMVGIIVDDAIVVGEHAATRRALGDGPSEAAETGARRMVAPVMSASLTTIAAFLPVLMISGLIGEIIQAIPYVVVAVIIASLIECFLVLPGHLRGALSHGAPRESAGRGLKARFHRRFDHFRDNGFRRFVALAVRWRYATLAVAVATLIVAVGLVAGGRVKFVFFPSPEGDVVFANFAFASGTPRERSEAMLLELERSLAEAEAALTDGEGGVVHAYFGQIGDQPDRMSASSVSSSGDNLGGLLVQLIPSERRDVRTQALIAAWRDTIEPPSGLDSLTIRERRGGPPGRDIDVRLSGGTVETLKAAALDLRERLTAYNGVTDVDDNLPYGKRELILSVTPRGSALGFTTESVGRQVRDAFEGIIAQRFARDDEEVVVRVQFPPARSTKRASETSICAARPGRRSP